MRPLEVTPNQAVPPVKDQKEVIMKVPPLKLRFKTGAVPTIEPKPIKPPNDEIEEEDEEYSGSESLGSDGGKQKISVKLQHRMNKNFTKFLKLIMFTLHSRWF